MIGPEGQAPFAWLAQDLHPSGAAGRAMDASPELGQRLVDHYSRALGRVLTEAAGLSLSILETRE